MYFDMRWDPPSCLLLEIEAVHVGGERGTGVIAWASHLLTPETEQSTHYFWAFARNSRLADAAFDTHLRAGISQAFVAEDAPIIEWQQRYLSLPGQEPLRHQSLPSDAGGARARAVIRRRLESQLSE
jgi:vanillate O-demethylase monooxygenase subunit